MIQQPLLLVTIYITAAASLRMLVNNRVTNTIFAIVLIASSGYIIRYHSRNLSVGWNRCQSLVASLVGRGTSHQAKLDGSYPELTLLDQDGNPTRLSDFRGKVLLIEYVGMSCPACIALSGGHRRGGFDNNAPQADLDSIRSYAIAYGNVNWNDKDLVFVQILLFNPSMQAPTQADAARWAKHFGFKRSANRIVLTGTPEMASNEYRQLIPGFQLVDRNFILRADSTGDFPVHDLYTELLPMLGNLLSARPSSSFD